MIKTFALNLTCLLAFVVSNVKSQPSLPKRTMDSLWFIYNDTTISITNRAEAIRIMAWDGYLYSKPDSAYILSQLQYDFSKKKNYNIGMWSALNTQAVYYRKKGEFNKAIELNYNILKEKELNKSYKKMANNFLNLGQLFEAKGDHDKSIFYYNKSLDTLYRGQNDRGRASPLCNIGLVYMNKGEFSKAREYLHQSLQVAEKYGDIQFQANIKFNLGNLHRYINDTANSVKYTYESLKLYRKINDLYGEARIWSTKAYYHIGIDKYSTEALDYFLKALMISEKLQDKPSIQNLYNNIGEYYSNNNNYREAFKYFNKSLLIGEEMGSIQWISHLYGVYSTAYLKLNNYDSASYFSKKQFRIADSLGISLQKSDAARQLINISNQTNDTITSVKFGSILLKSRFNDINNNFFRLLENEKQPYFAQMEFDFMKYYYLSYKYGYIIPELCDTAYNSILVNKGLTLKSSSAVRLSILTSGDTSLINLYENWLNIKSKVASLNSENQKLEKEALELEQILVRRSSIISDFNKLMNLNWKLVKEGLKKDEAAIEFINFVNENDSNKNIKYAALIVKPESAHPEIITLCNESDLEQILGTYQGNNLGFVNKVYGTKKEAQTALYEKIWKPLEESLKDTKTVYYSPTGLLHKISFAAINNGKNNFLCDNYKLNQLGSTGKVALPDNINYSDVDEFMVEGGVKYNSTQTHKEVWKYLPGTLSETQNIQKLLTKNKNKVNYYVSENASEENFKKNVVNANILHIATHGFFFPDPEIEREKMRKLNASAPNKRYQDSVNNTNVKSNEVEKGIAFRGTTNYANWSFVNNKNPLMRSGLVLANANDVWERDPMTEGEDGILTAQEVSNLDMRKTKLVVLSACETGLGDIKGSEGVYGLQRAFKMAGVKYIIMSLWQVPDKETSEFMITFYTKLTKCKDIKKAFNDTQKEMRKKYDPYFWAAFVLVE